jgi:hypothetical protein
MPPNPLPSFIPVLKYIWFAIRMISIDLIINEAKRFILPSLDKVDWIKITIAERIIIMVLNLPQEKDTTETRTPRIILINPINGIFSV